MWCRHPEIRRNRSHLNIVPPSNGDTGAGNSHDVPSNGDAGAGSSSPESYTKAKSSAAKSTFKQDSHPILHRDYPTPSRLFAVLTLEGEMWNNCNYYYHCHTHFLLLYNHDACMIKTVKILIPQYYRLSLLCSLERNCTSCQGTDNIFWWYITVIFCGLMTLIRHHPLQRTAEG